MIWVLIALGAVIAVILVLAAVGERSFQVTRAATLDAPAARLFELVEDLRRWPEWSPWEGLDPNMQRTYEGPARGVGAVYAWKGNAKAGAGRMEILESTAPSHLAIKLDFIKPFAANNAIAFTFSPDGAGTRVTWTMTGPRPFMLRLFGVFVKMDRIVGESFERGLASLGVAASDGRSSGPG